MHAGSYAISRSDSGRWRATGIRKEAFAIPHTPSPIRIPTMAAASLQELLSKDGFRRGIPSKSLKSDPLAISICRDRRSIDLDLDRHRHHRRARSLTFFSKSATSNSSVANSRSRAPAATKNEDTTDTVSSALSTYLEKYLTDGSFRTRLRERCAAFLVGDPGGSAHQVFVNLQIGIETVERLAGDAIVATESKIGPLRTSERLLSAVVADSSSGMKDHHACGVPNAQLSACAHLYLSFVYRMENDDRAAARHLLQVFCDAPRFARKSLLPDLWDHFFLPHLLHLKVWHDKEVEVLSGLDTTEKGQSMRGLNRVYNEQMDLGTAQFALYYKRWLKIGGKNAVAPSVSLPSQSTYCVPNHKQSSSPSYRIMHRAVLNNQKDVGDDGGRGSTVIKWQGPRRDIEDRGASHMDKGTKERTASSIIEHDVNESLPKPSNSYSIRLLTCRNDSSMDNVIRYQMPKKLPNINSKEINPSVPLLDLRGSISLISSSNNLCDCEAAVRVIARAWAESQGDPSLVKTLSSVSVIEGMLEVLLMSKNDEVLDLSICTLAELVTRNEVNRQVILMADPQLEIFMRLLTCHSLFLKVAVLLHLLRPKAKQMLSMDWIPLVLHVLDNSDQNQTLFSVRGSPKSAAFYLLEQLLLGFDVDRNAENAKQAISIGGLRLLMRWLEIGDLHERRSSATLLTKCMQADGSCREFLAASIKKKTIVQLLAGSQLKSNGCALFLLIELLCLGRRTQITKFIYELKREGSLNTMHILLVYLEQAPAEQRPLIAAILLQLDLLEDPLKYSIYREEAIDAIVRALDCKSRRVHEQCSRALLVLAGRFTSTGDLLAESWLLKKAGLDDCLADPYDRKDISHDSYNKVDETALTEEWLKRLANVLMMRGHKRFLLALSNSISSAIPTLTRSCLVTIAWMMNSIELCQISEDLLSLACSILTPRLLDCLKYDRALEERILASLSLFNIARNSDCLSKFMPFSKHAEGSLQYLSRFTWTAKELLIHAADISSYHCGMLQ